MWLLTTLTDFYGKSTKCKTICDVTFLYWSIENMTKLHFKFFKPMVYCVRVQEISGSPLVEFLGKLILFKPCKVKVIQVLRWLGSGLPCSPGEVLFSIRSGGGDNVAVYAAGTTGGALLARVGGGGGRGVLHADGSPQLLTVMDITWWHDIIVGNL